MQNIIKKLYAVILAIGTAACISACNIDNSTDINTDINTSQKDYSVAEISTNISTSITIPETIPKNNPSVDISNSYSKFTLSQIPEYDLDPVYIVNNNKPFFKPDEIKSESFENYSELDNLNRCQVAIACLSIDTMPSEQEKRGNIGNIKPSGWHTVKYPEVISDLYLYNRCHLIGWQLGNENDNELNLITGTRYLNIDGMLPYENQVAEYIKSTGNHVM